MMVNDEARPLHGHLRLSLQTKAGEELVRSQQPFAIDALASTTNHVAMAIPQKTGDYVLKAIAQPEGVRCDATVCRR